jgi:hypothetical protein
MTPRKPYEITKSIVENLGHKFIMNLDEYLNLKNTRKIKVLCKYCSSLWIVELANLTMNPNAGCKNCAIDRRRQNRKENSGKYTNFQKFLNSINYQLLNDKVEFLEQLNKNKNEIMINFKCDNNHINNLKLFAFCNKRDSFQKNKIDKFCNTCITIDIFEQKYTERINEIKLIFIKYNHTLLQLKENLRQIEFICGNCTKRGITSFGSITSENYTGSCVHCFNERNRKPYDIVKKEVEDLGFKLLTLYENYTSNKKLEIGCNQCDIYYNNRSLYRLKKNSKKHYHCKNCLLGVVGLDVKFEPYCFRCYCLEYPDEDIPKRFKIKETYFKDYIIDFLNDEKLDIDYDGPIHDKRISNACSRRRPDLFIDCYTHCIVLELDEFQHKNYSCENKRLCELWQDIAYRPIILLRLNPDNYIDKYNKTHKSCFKYISGRISTKEEWNIRLNYFCKDLVYYMTYIPNKSIIVKYYFYDEDENDKDDEDNS